jgi:capsule polysaccharide export protein KpsE/RkpR
VNDEMATPYVDLSFLNRPRVRRSVALGAAAGAALGILYWAVAPRWYQSTLTVVPAKAPATGGLANLLGGDLGGLAASVGGLGGATPDNSRIAAVLQSTAVTDEIIARYDLKNRYSDRTQEAARESLWDHCGVKTLPKPNLVQLWCEDRDPKFAQEMVASFAEIGNRVFSRISVGSASEEARYLDLRVADLRRQADDAATRMREFQEKHQIVDLESQARAVVTSVASVNAQKVTKKMELDYARRFSSADEAGTLRLRSQLSVLDDQLRDLEEPRGADGAVGTGGSEGRGSGLFPAALAVPKLRSEYERLYRDRKVAEASLVFALDRLEGAKASEARNVSTFQVLDPPTLPTRKSRPRGSVTAVLGLLLGAGATVAWEFWKSRRGVAPAA